MTQEEAQTKSFNEVYNYFKDNPDGTLSKDKSARTRAFVDFLIEGLKALLKQENIKTA